MKSKYYAIRIEFQVHGSLHVHCFLWVVNAPVLTSNNKEDYVAFLPEKKEEKPALHELVKLYQLHRHSKTFRKYKNEACRFKFGTFFSKETLVAEPLPESIPEVVKVLVLSKRKEILLKVKDYIKSLLNPSKTNFLYLFWNDFTEIKSISKVLKELSISEEEY